MTYWYLDQLRIGNRRGKKSPYIFLPPRPPPFFFFFSIFTESLISKYLYGVPPRSKVVSTVSDLLSETEGETVTHVRVLMTQQ